ncbi:MAG TPA: hypothetical protein VNM24_10765 [Burkholderiales bacterium]|jgi:hypothetical protein|nr:hypothetical protein [Burkholderiales bacterium]
MPDVLPNYAILRLFALRWNWSAGWRLSPAGKCGNAHAPLNRAGTDRSRVDPAAGGVIKFEPSGVLWLNARLAGG